MTVINTSSYFSENLSLKDFKKLSHFIHTRIGIKMPEAKKGMIEGRLRKRLRALNIGTYHAYCEYLFAPEGMRQELQNFIDVITTNKTDFFREADHFTFMVDKAFPYLMQHRKSLQQPIMIWSAASSSGNEAYTIAMVASEFGEKHPRFDYSILGTDISTDILKEAKQAVYPEDEIEPVPMHLRKKYLLRSKNRHKNLVRISPALRKKVSFRRLNLIEPDYKIPQIMDIIFCRNVMIYFDKETQEKLVARLFNQLTPGGYLFVGHSEVLHDCRLPLINVAPAVYQKKAGLPK